MGCKERFDYSEIIEKFPSLIPAPGFTKDTLQDLYDNADKWEWLRNVFADANSKKTLEDLLNFRCSARLEALNDYDFEPEEQYFDRVVELKEGESFVDCGGFDGDTSAEFIKRNPLHGSVYIFEPSLLNLRKAKSRLSGKPHIKFIQKGVSDAPAMVSFNSSGGSASAICENGSETIELTTIDNEIAEKISFIKMDLEGWESRALFGAKKHILEDHPKMAIAVYHSASDFWSIPKLVLGIRSDYEVFLRHYTQGWIESIMYFIPKKQNG